MFAQLVEPVLARVDGGRATRRMCRAWFARFSTETLVALADAPPEVFEVLVGSVVRHFMRLRRRMLWIVNATAFLQAASTAWVPWSSSPSFTLLCNAFGWWFVIRSWQRLTPEAVAPRFIIRIQVLPLITEELQNP